VYEGQPHFGQALLRALSSDETGIIFRWLYLCILLHR
jgi:hypothetical protein